MAKKTAYEPCMLCAPDEPCLVHAQKPTQKRAKKAPPLPVKVDSPSAEVVDENRSRSCPRSITPATAQTTSGSESSGMTLSDYSERSNTYGEQLPDITHIIGVPALSPGGAPTPTPLKQDVHAAMRARAGQAPAPKRVADAASDPVIDDAIRALEPLLHPVEKRKHQAVLTQPRTVVRRAEQWRAKRGGN